ncbi:MAG: HAD hydrolase family protein [Acidobacteriota bacterium]|nr:HAD hydrolase family protein [Acidobacteriota bacterium]
MKLFSLALDYDGTLAHDDRLDPAVRDAIALARRRGITVLLATGRILEDLRRVSRAFGSLVRSTRIAAIGSCRRHGARPRETTCIQTAARS